MMELSLGTRGGFPARRQNQLYFQPYFVYKELWQRLSADNTVDFKDVFKTCMGR